MTPVTLRRAGTLVALTILVGIGAACGSESGSDALGVLDELPQLPTTLASQPAEVPPSTATSQRACEELGLATASYRPSDLLSPTAMPAGSPMAAIKARGRLRVAVDENTLGFGYRDPATGDIKGFEVDLAHEIAKAIFGEAYGPGVVETVPVTTEEKVRVVRSGNVDMAISAISMGCRRWEDVAFSAEYYTAIQQLLVRSDSDVAALDDLAGRRVCVTAGSSSIDIMRELAPEAILDTVPGRTDCLLALQEGEVDAYLGHDSFLYGMLSQDPTVEVRTGLLPSGATASHYGIAISHQQPELVRFVNAVLDKVRTDGTWDALHRQLEDDLGIPPAAPPTPKYRD